MVRPCHGNQAAPRLPVPRILGKYFRKWGRTGLAEGIPVNVSAIAV